MFKMLLCAFGYHLPGGPVSRAATMLHRG